jgi:hypothetical protein
MFRLNNVDAQTHQQIEMWPKDILTHKFICTQKDNAQKTQYEKLWMNSFITIIGKQQGKNSWKVEKCARL